MENKTNNQKLKSLHNINKMPKIGKRQNAKIRKDTENLLKSIRNKINPRSFNAFQQDISTKRIDAVKNLAEKLKLIQSSTEKNITKSNLKESVKTIQKERKTAVTKIQSVVQKRRVVKNSIEIDNPRTNTIWSELKDLRNRFTSVRVSLVEDGVVIKSFIVDLTKNTGDVYGDLYYDLEYNNIFEEYPNTRLIITTDENIEPVRIAQAFKQGTTNCLFLPIIKWCEEKVEDAGTEGTKLKYKSKLNVAKKLEESYRQTGVVKEELQGIADKLQINIKIRLPFDADVIEIKSNKKPLTTFEYINTKLNHIDGFSHNEIVNKKIVEITTQEMNEMYNNLKDNKDYFIFKRNHIGVSQISTLNATYIQKQDYNEFTNEFMKTSGLNECQICDMKNYNLSQYVRAGDHQNETIDFKPMTKFDDTDLEEVKIEYTGYNHIDQSKAYKNVNKCLYYQGYLGKITDFRKTDKIQGIGLYTITNIVLSKNLQRLNNKMKIWKNGNVYPSPELDFLKDNGATFTITEGCWGFHIEFDFEDPQWLNKIDCGREKETYYYSKFVGCMTSKGEYDSFYMNAEQDYLQNLISYLDKDKYKSYEDEIRFLVKKDSNKHLTHVASFVKCYTRLNTLEQLLSMEYDDIIRVCVDGIYHFNEYPCKNIFRNDPKEIKSNYDTGSYISNYDVDVTWEAGEAKDFHKNELHTGCGGGGKTHKQLVDTGLQKIKYFAPSWKLARKKAQDYNVKVDVWANLLCNDPEKWKQIKRNYNVLVIDEISMLTDKNKDKILNRYSNCKIIMCGDPGFQLDPIDDDGKIFTKTNFEYYEEHNTNHRVQDDKLLFLLNQIRKMMKHKISSKEIRDYILLNFNKIESIKDYKVEDMILTFTNKRKDVFTDMYKHLNKYYITENTQQHSNGEIVFNKPDKTKCELRHAYTTHSIQGETAEANLYIDINYMTNKKMLYTALSRAKYHDQIHLITS